MRLTAIEVQNFRVLKNVRISFPDNVIGVIGPNGAGKSTLVEAISWALYGSPVARSGKDEIKSALAGPNEPCQVSLEFSVRAENYRVIRRLAGRLERPEVELYRSDASESVGVIETQRYVDELLGLDWQGFRTSFVARQQELNALSDLQPAKRRDQLAGMLGIERLDRAMQLLKEDTRSLERQADFLQRQLADIASVDQRIAQLREQIAVTTERARQAEQACRMAKSDFDIATSTMQQWQQTKSAWLKFQAQIDAGQKTKTLLSDQVRRLSEEQSRLTALESQLITLEKNLVQMPEIKRQFEMLKLAKSRLEARQSLLRQQSDLLSESIQTEIRLKEIERSLAEYSAQLSEIPDNVSDRLHELQILLDQARHDFGSLQGEKIALSKEIDTLDEQMQSIARFGPESVCDRCLRPLGDSLPQIKAHLHEERLKLQSSLGEIDERLRTKEEEGKKLKTDGDELQRLVQLHNTLTVNQAATLRERDSLLQRKEVINRQLQEISAQLEQFGAVEFDPTQFAALGHQTEKLEQDAARCNLLKGELSRLPAVHSAISDDRQSLERAETELTSLCAERDRLGFTESEFEATELSFTATQKKYHEAREELLTVSKETELFQKDLDGKIEQKKGFEQAAQELEQCRTSHYYGEKLAGLLAEFRSRLIARIRPTLAEFSSRLMADMTNGKYSLVELDEKYNLRIMDYGQYYAVDRFSGGEKDLANLCLRLAISQALTESAGLARSFIILDEVFGSQDSDRQDLILRALANLKNRFPQILLITHVEEIRDRVETLIEVIPTGTGWSEVRVNGNRV